MFSATGIAMIRPADFGGDVNDIGVDRRIVGGREQNAAMPGEPADRCGEEDDEEGDQPEREATRFCGCRLHGHDPNQTSQASVPTIRPIAVQRASW